MDFKIFFTTLATIFLLEMGDKTQMTAFVMAADQKGKWEVLAGIVVGLVLGGLLAYFAGRYISAFIPEATLRYVAGSIFIVFGLWMLVRA